MKKKNPTIIVNLEASHFQSPNGIYVTNPVMIDNGMLSNPRLACVVFPQPPHCRMCLVKIGAIVFPEDCNFCIISTISDDGRCK